MWRSLLILCVVVAIHGDEGEWRVVKTSQGPVKGRRDPAGVYVFNNIQYATVPKGRFRFSAPLPGPVWLNVIEPSEKSIVCPQQSSGFIDLQTKTVQEECLVANVYVPITEEKNLPVLVYIHGGAFEIGFGDMLTPKNFARENNVIVVTFNYRLGVHGFLCLGTEAAPGNAGLKDQVALLRWVKKNIGKYGGNPDDVTIAGYSAGSVSAHLLMLAKSTKGLFNKVILESGASVGSIAIQSDPLENAKAYARKLNFSDVDDIFALEQFYLDKPLEEIVKNSFFDRKDASPLFGPCIERKGKDALISEPPVSIIKKGEYKKVPILLGITNMEGLLQMPKFGEWKNAMNEKFSDFLPADLHLEMEEQKEEISKIVKEFYFGDKPVSEDTILKYIDYYSDVFFAYPTLRSVQLHAGGGHEDLYLYEYSFVDSTVAPRAGISGAGHCDQTGAIFDGAGAVRGADESSLSEPLRKMKATMRELWGNFVKHGKPVPEGSSLPEWPTAGIDRSPHMSLGQNLELRVSLLESRARFWDVIYHKLYKEPIPPPAPPHTEL
ncbi:para-nitrobenzyl esterase-like [Anticarsia gemmatalis]|uniref:para-nitrobenzyl esterase-like n=1 Tax=Anticarsia gemmatalis TaxID=129554 RepID=UPI003F775761